MWKLQIHLNGMLNSLCRDRRRKLKSNSIRTGLFNPPESVLTLTQTGLFSTDSRKVKGVDSFTLRWDKNGIKGSTGAQNINTG